MSVVQEEISPGETLIEVKSGREFVVLSRGGIGSNIVVRNGVHHSCHYFYVVQTSDGSQEEIYQIDIGYAGSSKYRFVSPTRLQPLSE